MNDTRVACVIFFALLAGAAACGASNQKGSDVTTVTVEKPADSSAPAPGDAPAPAPSK